MTRQATRAEALEHVFCLTASNKQNTRKTTKRVLCRAQVRLCAQKQKKKRYLLTDINRVGFHFPEELLVQFEPEFCALSANEGLSFPTNYFFAEKSTVSPKRCRESVRKCFKKKSGMDGSRFWFQKLSFSGN